MELVFQNIIFQDIMFFYICDFLNDWEVDY